MSRHNRRGGGTDQRGFEYRISYQPDWLDRIRVTRRLPTGRQSTKTLFRNPSRRPEAEAGGLIRTTIESAEQDLHVEVALRADADRVGEVEVVWRSNGGPEPAMDRVSLTLHSFPAHRSRPSEAGHPL